MPTTLANPSAYNLQRTLSTIPTLGSFVPSAHPFVGEMLLPAFVKSIDSGLGSFLFSLFI